MKRIFEFFVKGLIFLAITPILLSAMIVTWIVIAVAMTIGAIYIWIEFLIYDGLKIEKEIILKIKNHETVYDEFSNNHED